MIIKEIDISKYNVKLSEPFAYFTAKLNYLPYVLIIVKSDDGLVGYGEAALAWDVTGETQEGAKAIFKYIKPLLSGSRVSELEDIEKIMATINLYINNNSALKSGIEMALLDILGKNKRLPVYRLFSTKKCSEVIAQKVLSYGEEGQNKIIEKLKEAKKLGVKIIKIKVGQDNEKNYNLIKTIHDFDAKIKLALDVNQGWKNAKTAIPIIKKLDKFNIVFIEQPTKWDDIDELSKIRKAVNVKIMADESCHNLSDLKTLHQGKCIDFINIKIAKSGGFLEATKMIDFCKKNQIKFILGDMLYSSLGTAANLHLANLGDFESYDLTDPKRIIDDKFEGIVSDSCRFKIPQNIGLGVELKRKL